MLTSEQRAEFDRCGYIHLPRAFDPQAALRMADFLWERLRQLHGIDRDDSQTWSVPGAWVGLKDYKDDPIFAPIASPTLTGAIDDLLGAEHWELPRQWGGFLVKCPAVTVERWDVPHDGWHVDAHFTCDPSQLFGLRVFTFFSELEPRGGATLVVRGSHRLVMNYVQALTQEQRQQKYAVLLDQFKSSHPWLADLTSGSFSQDRVGYFMQRETTVHGIDVCVEELCASPGDVMIAHPWIFHAASQNARDVPRFQRAKDVYCKDAVPC